MLFFFSCFRSIRFKSIKMPNEPLFVLLSCVRKRPMMSLPVSVGIDVMTSVLSRSVHRYDIINSRRSACTLCHEEPPPHHTHTHTHNSQCKPVYAQGL